ncbi:MAG TPA: aldo/keto reductase [Balneolales bacterium]|nr:aldo/keto reductase [Balneolales bacterium]
MKYKKLGYSGLKVSELCMGTMTFGSTFHNIGAVDQKLANEMIAKAYGSGVNFFDTANVYSRGESEKILGQSLKDLDIKRDSVVLATKVRGAMSDEAAEGTGDVNNVGLSRKHIMEACEASLNRLNTDYIDLYQVHGWDPITPMEETLQALTDLVRHGKVRYIGVSNWAARQIAKALQVSKFNGWESFVSLQAYYSVAARDLEHELLPLSKEEGLGVLPWSPLSGGFLTGKYRRNQDGPEDARRTGFDFPPVDKEKAYDVVDAMDEIAKKHESSIPQVALAWLLEQNGVASVIIGAKNMSQLDDNLSSAEVELTADELATISEITQPPQIYPEWMIDFQSRGRK